MREHRVLKFFMPLLACVYGFATIYICGVIGGNSFSLPLFCVRVAVQIAFIALTVWIIRKPLTHLFPQVGAIPSGFLRGMWWCFFCWSRRCGAF